MRTLLLAGVSVGSIALLLSAAGSSSANPPIRGLAAPPIRGSVPAPLRRRAQASPEPCSSNYPSPGDYFVGVTPSDNAPNYAGGDDSAVLGGYSNYACGWASAIGAGTGNQIGGNDFGSFIGGGSNNFATGTSFVGAGSNNQATGTNSAVGAGHLNIAAGAYSFVGGGLIDDISSSGNGSVIGGGDYSYGSSCGCTTGGNEITGEDSFLGAGDQNGIYANQSFIGAGDLNTIAAGANGSIIGAGAQNTIGASGQMGVIGGGEDNSLTGSFAVIPGGFHNVASGAFSFAGGAYSNAAGQGSVVVGGGSQQTGSSSPESNNNFGLDAFIGGGDNNNLGNAPQSVIVGGSGNTITTNGQSSAVNQSTIGGGFGNTITEGSSNGGSYGVIAGGYESTLSGEYGVVGGGFQNVTTGATGTVAGGQSNSASGVESTVGGGVGNAASGQAAVVPGGLKNTAKGYASFAAGSHSLATATGTFVWSDDATNATQLNATVANSFLVRASGGVTFYSSLNLASGVKLAAGSGTWSSLSDRDAKTDVLPVDDESILKKIAALPLSTWRYKTEEGTRHLGPMAQDFYAAFRVGEDDRHITSIDEDGVALAAIKALHRDHDALRSDFTAYQKRSGDKVAAVRAEISRHGTEIAALQREINSLRSKIKSKAQR